MADLPELSNGEESILAAVTKPPYVYRRLTYEERAEIIRLVKAYPKMQEFIEYLYQLEPDLKKEGLKNFDGYFVHWDEIVKACLQGYPEGTKLMWDCSPAELIADLINERDEARK